MKHNYSHIQHGDKLHDEAIAQSIVSTYKKLCSFFTISEKNINEATTSEQLKMGRYLHDQEIGCAIKDLYKASTQSLKPRSHFPHHVTH